MAQLSIVNIKSDNPKYPQNNINVTVDNDLSPDTTIVIPDTFFPYIIEFSNLAEANGKRYMSDWMYKQLVDIHYTTPLGRVLFNLNKSISVIPYYTLDYQVFRDMVTEIRSKTIDNRGKEVSELEFVGASIDDFEVTPDYLLRWLDFPIADGKGQPINEFPLLIGYSNKEITDVIVEISAKQDLQDFFSNDYFVDIAYSEINKDEVDPELSYLNAADTLSGSLPLRQSTRDRLQNLSKRPSLDKLLKTASNITKTIAGVGVAAAAIASAAKLLQNPPKIPKLPKLPRVGLAAVIKAKMALKKKKGSSRKKKGKPAKKNGASDISQLSSNAKSKINKLQKNKFTDKLKTATDKAKQIIK